MTLKAIAAAAGLGLLAAGCNQSSPAPAKPEEKPPVAEQKPAQEDPAFARALNFTCEGGGKLDLVFKGGPAEGASLRMDGGAIMTLPMDTTAQDGMTWKDATTTLKMDGSSVSYTSGGATRTCTFQAREMPAPAAPGVVRTLTIANAGKSVEIKVGETLAVALSGVPTAGYVWAASSPPAFVKASDGPGGPTSTAQMMPGFAGGNHWEVILIEGLKAGEGEITLAQRRPWEDKATPDADTFKFKLKVS